MSRAPATAWSVDGGGAVVVATAVATAIVIGAAAAYSPVLTLAGAAVVALIAIVIGNLTYGVAVFTLLTFFEVLPGLGHLALSKPIGFVLVLSWLRALAREGRSVPLMSRDRAVLFFVLVTFAGWATMSAAWATDSGVALSNASRLILVVLLLMAIFTGIRSSRDLELVAWTFVSGAFLVSIVAIVTGGNKAGRLALGELDPNQLAAAIVTALVLALFLLCAASRRSQRLVLLVFSAMYIVTIMLTESRGAIVAGAIGAVAAIALAGPFRSRIVPLVLIIAALGVGYYAVLAPSAFRERVADVVTTERDPRLDSWSIARRVWEEHPVAGVGIGNFVVVEQAFLADQINLFSARKLHMIELVSHNTYLDVLTELGLIGFALFGTFVLVTIGAAVAAARRIDTQAPRLALTVRGLVAALVTLLAAYFFVSELYGKQLWLLLGLLATVPTVVRAVALTSATRPAGDVRLVLAESSDDRRGLPGAAGPP